MEEHKTAQKEPIHVKLRKKKRITSTLAGEAVAEPSAMGVTRLHKTSMYPLWKRKSKMSISLPTGIPKPRHFVKVSINHFKSMKEGI